MSLSFCAFSSFCLSCLHPLAFVVAFANAWSFSATSCWSGQAELDGSTGGSTGWSATFAGLLALLTLARFGLSAAGVSKCFFLLVLGFASEGTTSLGFFRPAVFFSGFSGAWSVLGVLLLLLDVLGVSSSSSSVSFPFLLLLFLGCLLPFAFSFLPWSGLPRPFPLPFPLPFPFPFLPFLSARTLSCSRRVTLQSPGQQETTKITEIWW